MKNFIKDHFGWFTVPILAITIIVLSIENTTVESILVAIQLILLGLEIYGAILFSRKNKNERNEHIESYLKQIENIKSSRLPEDKKTELIAMCQEQIDRLKKKI